MKSKMVGTKPNYFKYQKHIENKLDFCLPVLPLTILGYPHGMWLILRSPPLHNKQFKSNSLPQILGHYCNYYYTITNHIAYYIDWVVLVFGVCWGVQPVLLLSLMAFASFFLSSIVCFLSSSSLILHKKLFSSEVPHIFIFSKKVIFSKNVQFSKKVP